MDCLGKIAEGYWLVRQPRIVDFAWDSVVLLRSVLLKDKGGCVLSCLRDDFRLI